MGWQVIDSMSMEGKWRGGVEWGKERGKVRRGVRDECVGCVRQAYPYVVG